MKQSNLPEHKSQDRAIEAFLRSRYGAWISCWEVAHPPLPFWGKQILEYGRAISSIRKRLKKAGDLECIENRTERVAGEVHGFYRIIRTIDALGIAPAKQQPLKSWEQVCKEREEKMRQAEPSFELVP